MTEAPQPIDALLHSILQSARYRAISPDLIRSIGTRELARRKSLKEAVKRTKDKLHQIGGAYLDHRVDYKSWLEQLRAASVAADPAVLRESCAQIMSYHASSRERLGILSSFYATTLGALRPIHSVLDIACGLNPLAIPWMPLAADVEYHAYDIYLDLACFLESCLPLLGVRGHAQALDVVQHYPTIHADLALVLKTLPCLEQIDKTAGLRLLESLDADHILVSFPVRSLGGAAKGMPANYEAHFQELVAGRPWSIQRFSFPSELAFLITRS